MRPKLFALLLVFSLIGSLTLGAPQKKKSPLRVYALLGAALCVASLAVAVHDPDTANPRYPPILNAEITVLRADGTPFDSVPVETIQISTAIHQSENHEAEHMSLGFKIPDILTTDAKGMFRLRVGYVGDPDSDPEWFNLKLVAEALPTRKFFRMNRRIALKEPNFHWSKPADANKRRYRKEKPFNFDDAIFAPERNNPLSSHPARWSKDAFNVFEKALSEIALEFPPDSFYFTVALRSEKGPITVHGMVEPKRGGFVGNTENGGFGARYTAIARQKLE